MNKIEVSDIRERNRRIKEDYDMPMILPFLPAILAILTVFVGIGGIFLGLGHTGLGLLGSESTLRLPLALPFLGFAALTGIAAFIIGLYVLYKWIDRRSKHFKRVMLLYNDVLDFLEEKGVEKEAKKAKRSLREMESESSDRPAILWVIISMIFQPVLLYVFHFLTRDFYKHEKNENLLLEDISDSIESAGGEFEFEGYNTVEDRDTILYIVLTIVTLGLFGLYWIYVITDDPNKHFRESRRAEDRLLSSLEEL